jgi:hypothetical protein
LRRSLSTRAERALFAGIVTTAALMVFAMMGGVGVAGTPISAAQYQYDKVTICHVTGAQPVTITVAASALPAHRRHGDIPGFCPR